MIEIQPELLVVLMFGLLIVFVILGYPLGFVLGGIGLIMGVITNGIAMTEIVYLRMFGAITTGIFLASRWISRLCFSLKPVVPITIAFLRRTAILKFWRVAAGVVKSITT